MYLYNLFAQFELFAVGLCRPQYNTPDLSTSSSTYFTTWSTTSLHIVNESVTCDHSVLPFQWFCKNVVVTVVPAR